MSISVQRFENSTKLDVDLVTAHFPPERVTKQFIQNSSKPILL
jgi:hypothetical protein